MKKLNIKEYKKPIVVVEDIEITDIITTSSNSSSFSFGHSSRNDYKVDAGSYYNK